MDNCHDFNTFLAFLADNSVLVSADHQFVLTYPGVLLATALFLSSLPLLKHLIEEGNCG